MAEFDDIKFTFLYIDLYSMGKTWYYPESVVPYNMLRYIVKGEAEFCINDEKFNVRKNQIVYIPSGCKLSCNMVSDTFEFYSIRFITSVFYNNDDILEKYYKIPRISEGGEETKYFEEIYRWAKSEYIAKKCFIRGYLNLLLGMLSCRGNEQHREKEKNGLEQYNLEQIAFREQKCNNMDSRVRIVSDYITLHPAEKYTPEIMAKMVGLSKQRFSSLFKNNMGKTPMEYVREIKLSTAARWLLTSNENISEIAYKIGYSDPNYFIREFKMAFGYTPNQYRNEGKEL